ncbi:MAG: TRAP transporter substrate-binding protein [Rhodospirillales bacterium]|nr:TRAP transporter substrate-binding protein [Rhodospirillales bacterium]
MKNSVLKSVALTAAATFMAVSTASAADNLRIQTHFSAESLNGKMAQQFFDDAVRLSNGALTIEPFFSSSVVKSVETFDAASTGILDCDMTGSAYQTGKDAAFQFFGDVMGGYNTPDQMRAWFEMGGGRELADPFYAKYNMYLVGLWGGVPESLSSTKPLAGPADLKNWKFRSPPGMETEIFAAFGASPIVMDFGEVFTALSTGIVDGADASQLNTNVSLGLYEIATHATYPGWHSMPSDHLACNKEKWDSLPANTRDIIKIAFDKMAYDMFTNSKIEADKAAAMLITKGITLHAWSAEDLRTYRDFVRKVWLKWAEKSETSGKVVASHLAFMKEIGLVK